MLPDFGGRFEQRPWRCRLENLTQKSQFCIRNYQLFHCWRRGYNWYHEQINPCSTTLSVNTFIEESIAENTIEINWKPVIVYWTNKKLTSLYNKLPAYVCECVRHASVSKGLWVQMCMCASCVCALCVCVKRVSVSHVCASIWTKWESGTFGRFEISWLTIRFIYFMATTGQFGQNLSPKICKWTNKELLFLIPASL